MENNKINYADGTILVFDTETIGLQKPFCYDLGYVIIDPNADGKILLKREFIIEQIWNNRPLFETAYFAAKRPIYTSRLKGRKAELMKWGFAMSRLIHDIKSFNVKSAYAFNSPFDDKVIDFNADYFHTRNGFDTTETYDIRGYAIKFLADGEYKRYCKDHREVKSADGTEKFFTENGNYASTAESFYCYLHGADGINLNEEHTALTDSEWEAGILLECLKRGATLETAYAVPKIIPTEELKTLSIINADGEELFSAKYSSKRETKSADGRIIKIK